VQGPNRSFRPLGVWSTDGKAIIFYERNLGIRSRDLDTGQEVELYKAADESRQFTAQNLALSPDGRWLAFGDRGIVMIMSSAGGAPRERLRIRRDEGSLTGLEWAGDGKYLLFSIGAGGPGPNLTPELWRMAVDDGQRQKVGLATQNSATLAIHPDGRQIAFTAGETKQEVWVMENLLPPLKVAR
jgi:Tol biopolymer transport system component